MTSANKFSDFFTLPQLSKRIQWYLSTLFSLEIPPTPIRKSKNFSWVKFTWFLPSNSESTNWSVSSKGLPPTKRDNLVVFMLVWVFGWGWRPGEVVHSRLVRHVSNSTGIWAQGDPNGRHKTASRPARSRGWQAMTPHCQDYPLLPMDEWNGAIEAA